MVGVPRLLPVAEVTADTAGSRLVSRADGPGSMAGDAESRAPSISDDGKVVAFESDATNLDPDLTAEQAAFAAVNRQVYIREADTTELVSLAPGEDSPPFPGDASAASVSEDGRYVAFQADTTPYAPTVTGDLDAQWYVYAEDRTPAGGGSRVGGLYVVSDDGDDAELIPNTLSDDPDTLPTEPAFSPDATRVAFARGGDIYAIDVDGSDLTQLTEGDDIDAQPAWSPDGQRIAYASDLDAPGPDGPPVELRVIDVTTRTVTTVPLGTTLNFVADPAWSPHGDQIAFAAEFAFDGFTMPAIYVWEPGSDPYQEWWWVTSPDVPPSAPDGPGVERRPTWSPDGEHLVFERRDGTTSGLRTIAVNGEGGSEELTPADGLDAKPSWSGDGQSVVFSRGPEDAADLFVVPVDMTGLPTGTATSLGLPSDGDPDRTWPSASMMNLSYAPRVRVTATVQGLTAPTGPVTFGLCAPDQSGQPPCGTSEQVAPRVELQPVDATTSTASITTTDLEPLPHFDQPDEPWCWRVDYLGGGLYGPAGASDRQTLCHTPRLTPVSVGLTLFDEVEGGPAFVVGVEGEPGSGEPTGYASVWHCEPDEAGVAGCPDGGTRISFPSSLHSADDDDDEFSSAEINLGSLDDYDEGSCFRVEYSGDQTYQRQRTWSSTWCFGVGTQFGHRIEVHGQPDVVDYDEPVEPEDVLAFASTSYDDDVPVDFYLCGPAAVTRYGCETGGQLVADDVALSATGESDPRTRDVTLAELGDTPEETALKTLAEEGVYCWRAELDDGSAAVAGLHPGPTACFGVQQPYDVGPGGIAVYVRDRQEELTTLVSVVEAGDDDTAPDVYSESTEPSISDDGLSVAFTSDHPLTSTAHLGEETHVYLRDFGEAVGDQGTTQLVSVFGACPGGQSCGGDEGADRDSRAPSISGDATHVAFASRQPALTATNPVTDDPWVFDESTQVFVRDLEDGTTTIESIADEGAAGDASSDDPALDGDADRVAFRSGADNLFDDPPATDPGPHVYLRDRTDEDTLLVSETVDGAPLSGVDGPVGAPDISGDGAVVAFGADATNLVPEDPCDDPSVCDPYYRVFKKRVADGRMEVASLRSDGSQPPDWSVSDAPTVDGDATVIAFESDAEDLDDSVDIDVDYPEFQIYARGFPGELVVVPEVIPFGPVNLDSVPLVPTEAPATVQLLTGIPITLTADDFAITGLHGPEYSIVAPNPCVGAELVAGGPGCEVTLAFAPAVQGLREAELVVADDELGVGDSSQLEGRGTAGEVTLEPASFDFGEAEVGEESDPETFTLTNVGDAPVTITAAAIVGADLGMFIRDSSCPAVVAPTATCTYEVTYRPLAEGVHAARLEVAHSAQDSPDSSDLRGRAGPIEPPDGRLVVTPDPVDFGVVPVDATSDVRVVTVINVGEGPVTIAGFALSGPAADRFSAVSANDTCTGATLAPAQGCGIAFQAQADEPGEWIAQLTIDSDSVPDPAAITLRALTPLLELDPALGPPGFVTEVRGRFFPPDTDVDIQWVPGLGGVEVRSDADGEFDEWILIFHRDLIGRRMAVAGDGTTDWASAEFLVMLGSSQPGDFSYRR